jgi:membrane fusion protein (multidrug efflux system)
MSFLNRKSTPWILAGALSLACGRERTAEKPAPPAPAAESPKAGAPTEKPPSDLPEDVKKGLAEVAGVAAEEPEDPSVLQENGELVSPVQSELAAKFPGRVGKVFVDEGARVRRGQPLLELETDYLKIELDRAQAAVARTQAAEDEARRDYERKEGLVAKGSVSQAVYDRTKATLDQAIAGRAEAEAAASLAMQRLEDAVLVSPIDGIVSERRTDVGERLGDSSVAFVLMQISPLKIRFRLPERYLARVQRGQIVRARVEPYPGEVFEGKVTVVVRAVDRETRTFAVEAEIENRDERLRPGLFARVELEIDA